MLTYLETLGEKKRAAKDLAASVNATKNEIDSAKSILDEKRSKRLEEEGELAENVYDEEEFKLLTELKDVRFKVRLKYINLKKRTLKHVPIIFQLKTKYKDNHRELKCVQSDMSYCQKLVDQARQRLVTEFDQWYTESFVHLGDQTRPSTTTAPLTAMAPSPSPQTVCC